MNPAPLLFLKRSPPGCSPWCAWRAGLGSKVSTCDGPPFMKRKMMRLARGRKCAARVVFEAAAAAAEAGPRRLARPSRPNPADRRWSIWRRESLQVGEWRIRSVHIQHFIRDQQQLRILLPTRHLAVNGLIQKSQGESQFLPRHFASEQKLISLADPGLVRIVCLGR